MKVLFVIDDLSFGGAQRQMTNLAVSLTNLNNEVTVLTYFRRDHYCEILNKNDIKTILLEIKNPVIRILRFRSFIRKGKYDCVISFLGIPNFLCEIAAIPSKKWRLIVNERSANPAIQKSLKSIFIRFFHLFADSIVFNSYSNRDIVKKVNPFLSSEKLIVIYNMLDTNKWKPESNYEFLREDRLTIIVAASQRYLKNFLGLLNALMQLTEFERKKLIIKWFGNNLEAPYLDNSILECKAYIKANKIDDTVLLYPANYKIREEMLKGDVIGLFSFFEGLPNGICEGMALGKPVISSAISDIPLFIKDGINGKLCNPSDVNSIADSLRYFLQLDRIKLAEIGCINREKAIELFDENKNIAKFMELMK